MWSKTTIEEQDMNDNTLDELASDRVDFHLPPLSTAPARPQRATRKQDWLHLLSDDDNDEYGDPLNDDPDFAFAWDV
jgi:hypothetical protein